MKLAFTEISQEKTYYTLGPGNWFPADEIPSSRDMQAEIEVWKKTNTMVFLQGNIQFAALLACDRCGVAVERLLKEEFEYILTVEEQRNAEPVELECSEDDCNTLYLEQPIVDVDVLLREQVLLALPVRTLCTEDCRGLCASCGALLKNESCSCSSGSVNSPFAVLERLRKA